MNCTVELSTALTTVEADGSISYFSQFVLNRVTENLGVVHNSINTLIKTSENDSSLNVVFGE